MTAARYPHVDYSRLPGHMQDGAREYVEQGYEPWGFLAAVLCNDLTLAFGRADHINTAAMGEWARWLWGEAPSQCWGSRAKVEAWIAAVEEGPFGDPAITGENGHPAYGEAAAS